ncbi:hypothetical protein EJD97_013760 [Solanum chilense]|uniref:Tetratricopeptide repeat protein 5 OB fold domain-containing protein n=1 Tax=Solanum chilense TaxID=4083 RepID=A0A6N2BAI4_SOLCI|nr:hypothetical protein EJD97_013760 [Solanum chilense]
MEQVSTRLQDLKYTIEALSTHLNHLKSTAEVVSTILKDLKSAIEEVSTHQKDLKSSIEDVFTHLNESNSSLKMSTPTEEVSREKGQVSADLKSNIEQVSTHLKESNYEDWVPIVTQLLECLCDFCDQRFPSTTQRKISEIENERNISEIEHQIDSCIELLDSIPKEKRELDHEDAMLEYLKGRFYNAIPDVYNEKAEHHLRKATDLKSLWLEAWDCLGLCLAKKGDYLRARDCYKIVLKFDKENRGVLRRRTDLEMKIAILSENPAPHLKSCIKYAGKTLALDRMDGDTLGRAYMEYFFVSKGMDRNKLRLALQAFENAKEIPTEKSNAQLVIHCSVVNRFLENCTMCLKGFSDAASMDATSGAFYEKQVTIKLLDKFQGLLQGKRNDKNKGKSKGKSQGKNKRKCNGMDGVNPPYKSATVDLLTEGPNNRRAVVAEVQCLVEYAYRGLLYYMLCDSDENSFVLTMFNTKEKEIKQGDQVTLLDPICKFVDFEWEGKHYEFKSVRVNLLEQVLVNGNPLRKKRRKASTRS